MAASAADFLTLMLEQVRKEVPNLTDLTLPPFIRDMENVPEDRVSDKSYRIPLRIRNGTDFRTVNLDSDTPGYGRGSGPAHIEFVGGHTPFAAVVETTEKALFTTGSTEQAVKSAAESWVAESLAEIGVHLSYMMHGSNIPLLVQATAQTTTASRTVYTADTAIGVQRVRRHMPVHVWDNGLSTCRTAAVAVADRRVFAVNHSANTVTLTSTISGAAATDKILIDGFSAANPTGLQGIEFFNDGATSGTLLGVDRAVYPEVAAIRIDAEGGDLVGMMLLRILRILEERRGTEVLDGLKGVTGTVQREAYYQQGLSIGEFQRQGTSYEMPDTVPSVKSSFMAAGITIETANRHRRSRVDLYNPKLWTKAVAEKLKMVPAEGGGAVHRVRAADGGIAPVILTVYQMDFQTFCVDPGRQGFIDNLGFPA